MLGKFSKRFFKIEPKLTKSSSDKCLSDLDMSFHTDVIENDVMDNLSSEIGNSISKSLNDSSIDDNDFIHTSLFLFINTMFQMSKYTFKKLAQQQIENQDYKSNWFFQDFTSNTVDTLDTLDNDPQKSSINPIIQIAITCFVQIIMRDAVSWAFHSLLHHL
jgi:hypothetical protein